VEQHEAELAVLLLGREAGDDRLIAEETLVDISDQVDGEVVVADHAAFGGETGVCFPEESFGHYS